VAEPSDSRGQGRDTRESRTSDLLGDLRQELAHRLRSEGYDVPDDEEDVVRWYFTTRARRIPRQRRNVLLSTELRARDMSADEAAALRRVESFTRDGKNLNPFLSRRRLMANFNDRLFVSWRIHHFHLGRPSGQHVAGTGRLLFARVESTTVYFIDLRDHDAFASQDLLRIVHANWPHLESHQLLRGIRGPRFPPELSEKDRKRARDAGVTVLDQIGRHVFGPSGGGLATDGSSIAATAASDRLTQRVRDIQVQLDNRTRAHPEDRPRFRLLVKSSIARVIDLSNRRILVEIPLESGS
jgi:hypothetical protein